MTGRSRAARPPPRRVPGWPARPCPACSAPATRSLRGPRRAPPRRRSSLASRSAQRPTLRHRPWRVGSGVGATRCAIIGMQTFARIEGTRMLRPQDNGIRECVRLDGVWRFRPDAALVGRTAGWWRGPLAEARDIAVPASFNDLFVDDELHDLVGDVWYQRTLYVPAGWAGSASSSGSMPRRTGRPCGSTTNWWSSTRVATRRSRPTSPTSLDPGRHCGSPWPSTTSSRSSRCRPA